LRNPDSFLPIERYHSMPVRFGILNPSISGAISAFFMQEFVKNHDFVL
jgi:hypothetical protein